jgi:ABC-type lipoprotein export system ATPase subunit
VANVWAYLDSREVRKRYGIAKDRLVRAAHDVSLTIEAGAFVALTWASGSSEATLVTATAGSLQP